MIKITNMNCYLITNIVDRIKNRKRETQNDIESLKQYSLTPSYIEKTITIKNGKEENSEKNPAYQPILDIAKKLSEKEIKNIALTGPFGSGKSSVLSTLEKDYPKYKYLKISLATLDCVNYDDAKSEENETQNGDSNGTEERKTDNLQKRDTKKINPQKEESLNRKIEYSILQQLIYKEKIETLPHSRFKRIRHISDCKSYILAFAFVLFIICCSILLEPEFLHIQSLYTIFNCSEKWKVFWDIISIIYIIFFSIYSVEKLITKTYNNRINKFNLKDGEIEINESTSIFNKHLDEIIYFFEVTNYDVVIIEDLDRFDTNNIFLKLRELNFLLNSSNAIKRKLEKIVFIYAIKDDMFKDTSRTKFFDYISTVIPVINPSNSRDKLYSALKEEGVNDISEDVCMDLGIYIDDMRILKNIVNEYIQYRQKLGNLFPKKLLGMILYKNYHPDDFAKLNNQDGIVYKIISERTKYCNSIVNERNQTIKELKTEKEKIINYYSNEKAKELRAIYVMKYLEINDAIQYFIENSNIYFPSKFVEDEKLFEKLENNSIPFYHKNSIGNLPLVIKFKDIENKVDPNYSYRERLTLYPNRVKEINTEIEKLQQEIFELRSQPLHQILKDYSANDFYKDTNENKIIAFLIREGYIDECYYDYISYFYPGIMTPSDRDFIQNIKIGIEKEYNYKIYKPKAVVNDIPESYFSKSEILNVDILDYIIINRNQYPSHYIFLKNNIKKQKKFDFIETYYKEGKEVESFFKDIFLGWNDFFSKGIVKEKSSQIADINFELLLTYFPKSNINKYDNKDFKDYIAEKFSFIAEKLDKIGLPNIEYIVQSLKFKFKNISVELQVPTKLMDFIIDGRHYDLTRDNIKSIIRYINPSFTEIYNNSSYSAIINTQREMFISYIEDHITECINSLFPDTSNLENEEAIKKILENEDIKDGVKTKYLSKQVNKVDIDNLSPDFWDIAFNANIIKPTWKSIENYISNTENQEINSVIIDFISKNSEELSLQSTKDVLTDSDNSKLFNKLLGTNVLPLKDYKKIRKSFNIISSSFDFKDISFERVEVLINTKGIEFNSKHFNSINDNYRDLASDFILQNKSEFFSNIESYPLLPETANSLLNCGKLSLNEELQIIQSLSSIKIDTNSTLSDSICTILNSSDKIPVENDFILTILKNATSQKSKLSLFVKKCTESPYIESFVKKGLELLGGDYAKIALQKENQGEFTPTIENKKLAEYLFKNSFISSYDNKGGTIRMNARNI